MQPTKKALPLSSCQTVENKLPTFILFLKMYPGMEKPFFLSIGSLKMTSCSNRKTRLSLVLERKLLSCSVTVNVSCWSSLPWAVIFPWNHREIDPTNRRCGYSVVFTSCIVSRKVQRHTSKPCSRPTFIMSLQRFGTKHITSTAFCKNVVRNSSKKSLKSTLKYFFNPVYA